MSPADGESAPEPRSAREVLVAWANQQDAWVRAIVGEVITTRRPLAEEAIEAVKTRYLAEKQLTDTDVPGVAELGEDQHAGVLAEPLTLLTLRECSGVNALAAGQ